MQLKTEKNSIQSFKGDAVFAGLFKDQKISSEISTLGPKLKKTIEETLALKEFEAESSQLYRIPTLGEAPFRHLVLIGLGESKKATGETFRKAAATAVLAAKSSQYKTIALLLLESGSLVAFKERVQASAEGALLASYSPPDFRTTKTGKQKRQQVEQCVFLCSEKQADAQKIVSETQIVGEFVFKARDWVNRASSEKTPVLLAREIAAKTKKAGVKCTVFDKKQIEKMNMGGVLAVNAGSEEPPVFIKLEHKPARYRKTVALVGKGITFDSGGLNIKPWEGMLTMKQDMAGAATVVATVFAAAALKLPVHVYGFCPFTENMPGNKAMKCMDIAKTFNGKTIEIIHTDAEGRIVLADALAFAESHKPDCMIDLATLTGAQDIALGRYFIGAMGNNPQLLKKILEAGNKTFERCWELPLIPEWDELVKSDVADLRNISKNKGEAGTLIGGAFLKQFVEKTPWVHLDIASTAFFLEGDSSRPYLVKGASGVGVRLLVEWLRDFK